MICGECGSELLWYCSNCWGGDDSLAVVWAIDGNWLVRMFYHADEQSAEQNLQEWCQSIVGRFNPAHVICGFDSEWNWRKFACPEYKANRKAHEPALDRLIEMTGTSMLKLGWRVIRLPGFEADDVIASVASQNPHRTVIVSGDNDMISCLRQGVVSLYRKRREGWSFMTANQAEQSLGFDLSLYRDYKCLVGDSSDNLKGCEKIGVVTAQKMLQDRSLDEIMANITQYKHIEQLREFSHRLPMLRTLMTPVTTLPILGGYNGECEHRDPDRQSDERSSDEEHTVRD